VPRVSHGFADDRVIAVHGDALLIVPQVQSPVERGADGVALDDVVGGVDAVDDDAFVTVAADQVSGAVGRVAADEIVVGIVGKDALDGVAELLRAVGAHANLVAGDDVVMGAAGAGGTRDVDTRALVAGDHVARPDVADGRVGGPEQDAVLLVGDRVLPGG